MKILPWLLSVLFLQGFHGASEWKLADVAERSTVEFLTVGPEEGEHWSTVWFVAIDDAIYFRLGPRAANRIDKNTTSPRMQLRFDGKDVYAVRYEKVPDKAQAVATAMREKYWSDILGEPFRKLGLTSETVTLRLSPEPAAN